MDMTTNLVEDNIKITFDKHLKLFNLNQIEISGIWGYGNYDVIIFTEQEKIIINYVRNIKSHLLKWLFIFLINFYITIFINN